MEKNTNGPNSFEAEHSKDKELLLSGIRNRIEKGEGLPFTEIKKKYGEHQLFYISLKYVTTTKKSLCKAIGIPVEAACRYKRYFEDRGLLVQSEREVVCDYTKHPAHLLSTNPDEFSKLGQTNQLKLFSI